MSPISITDDLYRYNSWANQRIFALCHGITDEQLDEPRQMGFGSLRKTLFHILAAEEIWLERWAGTPWRTFPMEAQGLPLRDIAARLESVSSQRQELLNRERANGWKRLCQYKDSKGNVYSNHLDDLLLHVANHGIHHRAQALNYLKRFGRKLPGGLDFLFYRLAQPAVKQEPATAEALRQYGLEIDSGPGAPLTWDGELTRKYFDYGDWANDRLLDLIVQLDDAALDRSWDMGMDTIRKNALHLWDAERWWLRNWIEGPAPFEISPASTSIQQLRAGWSEVIARRNQFARKLDDQAAARVVNVSAGGPLIKVAVIESLVQLCGHGTHHRAQLVNMLRRSGVTAPGLDYVLWIRETATPPNTVPS